MDVIPNPVQKFLDPAKIIAQLGVAKNSKVADFGSGPGYFTFPFADAVGKDGIVYSFDVLPQITEAVAGRAKFSGATNVIAKRVNLEKAGGTNLKDGQIDWVILKDIIFQNQKKEEIIKEAYRILKSGGSALFIEWNNKQLTVGPSLETRIPEKELKEMLMKEKFTIEKEIEAGSFHYAFIAKK